MKLLTRRGFVKGAAGGLLLPAAIGLVGVSKIEEILVGPASIPPPTSSGKVIARRTAFDFDIVGHLRNLADEIEDGRVLLSDPITLTQSGYWQTFHSMGNSSPYTSMLSGWDEKTEVTVHRQR